MPSSPVVSSEQRQSSHGLHRSRQSGQRRPGFKSGAVSEAKSTTVAVAAFAERFGRSVRRREIDEHPRRSIGGEARADLAYGVAHWPGSVALLATALLLAVLLDRLTPVPIWLPPAIAVALAVPVSVVRRTGRHRLGRWLALALPAAATAGVAISVGEQVRGVDDGPLLGQDLMLNAALIWAANVLAFAMWFWEIDGGGPARRRTDAHASDDILFPQMNLARTEPAWFPTFLDYLFFSFNTSTAFSPTDTTVLSRRGKLLMMTESTVSLAIIVILLARANAGR